MADPNVVRKLKRKLIFTEEEVNIYHEDQMDVCVYLSEGHTWKETEIFFGFLARK